MNSRKLLRVASASVASLMLCASAQAQLFRAYLASNGNDANPCNIVAPCRLLPAALIAVASGGEIWMLDSANFNGGPVNVTKSVTILAIPGAVGSVVALGGDAIVIATGGVKVALRNLVIVPFPGGGGTNGINMTNGAALTVENCLFANLPQSGIFVNTAASVRITNTTIRDNAYGVYIQGGATADISGAKILGNGTAGLYVYGQAAGQTIVTLSESILANNGVAVHAFETLGTSLNRIAVIRSTISHNTYGLRSQFSGGPTVISVSESLIADNTTPFAQEGGGSTMESLGNNTWRFNGTGVGTLTQIALF